jgi:hypothetical protein
VIFRWGSAIGGQPARDCEGAMHEPGTRLTLARAFGRGRDCYRVLAAPDATSEGADAPAEPALEVAELRLNRAITLPGGEAFTITRHGGIFSTDRALRRATQAGADEPPLALCYRERRGLRSRLRVSLAAAPERWLWLRRRAWYSSPANRDVVAVATGAEPSETDPVLLRVERRGGWRRHLQATWLAPADLPLPVVVFLLSVLVEEDRRAAAAAAASAAGV